VQTSLPPAPIPRERLLRVRVTDAEHARLVAVAAKEGRSLSELVRCCLPLMPERDGVGWRRQRSASEGR
jgi:hypothetical protein